MATIRHELKLPCRRALFRGGSCPPLIWEQRVRGDITCFQCEGERVFLGTGTGAIHLWNFSRGSATAAREMFSEEEHEWDGRPEKQKREKKRGNIKIRGRFPKTQGFTNAKGFFSR